jgi:hypothetical protein
MPYNPLSALGNWRRYCLEHRAFKADPPVIVQGHDGRNAVPSTFRDELYRKANEVPKMHDIGREPHQHFGERLPNRLIVEIPCVSAHITRG